MANINMLPETHVFDETGKLAENYVPNEMCVLENRNVRALAPKFGAFFTDSLKIRDATGKTVARSKYQFGLFNEIISAKVGKEIAGAIIILDKTVTAPLYIDYQCVGGPWGATNERIMELFTKLMTDDRPVAWPDILGKPDEYKPAHHWQDIGDLYGAEYLVAALERLCNAILMGDNASHDEIWRRIDTIYLELRQADENILFYVNAELAKKADKTYVDTQLALKADKTWVATELAKKSDLTYVNAELAKKADLTYVNAELAKKADKTYVDTQLALKADKTYVDTQLALKADKTTMAIELAKKADLTYVNAELAKKADKSYVDTELAKKADKTYVDTQLALKADKTYVDTQLALKADKTTMATELAKKADLTYVNAELAKKADKTYVDTQLGTKADTTWATAQLALKADKTVMAAELAKKADLTYVNAELAKKSDLTYVNAELAKKSDLTYVNAELAKKADKTELAKAVSDLTAEINKGILTADTTTIDLSGTGKTPALSASLKISTRAGNRLITDDTGVGVWDSAPPNVQWQWVDYIAGRDTNVGNMVAPLKTLRQAFANIANMGGVGSYVIYMKADQTHVLNQPLPGLHRATVDIVAYGDGRYPHELIDGGPGYYWWTAADYGRPILDFRVFNHPSWPQYTAHSILDVGTLYLRGLQLNMPTAMSTTPGYPQYVLSTENSMGRIWNQGCNFNFRMAGMGHQSIARGGVLWHQNCHLMNFPVGNGASNKRFSDTMLQISPGGDGDYDWQIVPLDSRLPTFQGRRVTSTSVLRAWNLTGGGYDIPTKTLYGTIPSYDIFGY